MSYWIHRKPYSPFLTAQSICLFVSVVSGSSDIFRFEARAVLEVVTFSGHPGGVRSSVMWSMVESGV